jgi:threonine dehydrogenase-like Zn-dependent dehydrogenase
MLALVNGDPPVLRDDYARPTRAPGEARMRLLVAGVCDTDLQLARGYLGFSGVLGHEFVGEVVEADDRAWIGRRVVADINAGCGTCAECRERGGHHCARRSVLGIAGRDGAFAEEIVAPERCLVAVPDAISDEQAVFAEPLAAALHVLDDVPRGPVVVLGDGKLGQLVIRALLSAGVPVIAIGHHPEKLALAGAVGAEVRLETELGDLARVPAVVEATGSAAGLRRALTLVQPRGTIVLKTTVAGACDIDLSPVVIDELRVVGSRCGDLRRAIEALASGQVDPAPLVSARFPLSRADVALRQAGVRGTLKVLVENG